MAKHEITSKDIKSALSSDMEKLGFDAASLMTSVCSRLSFKVDMRIFSSWLTNDYVEPSYRPVLRQILGKDSETFRLLDARIFSKARAPSIVSVSPTPLGEHIRCNDDTKYPAVDLFYGFKPSLNERGLPVDVKSALFTDLALAKIDLISFLWHLRTAVHKDLSRSIFDKWIAKNSIQDRYRSAILTMFGLESSLLNFVSSHKATVSLKRAMQKEPVGLPTTLDIYLEMGGDRKTLELIDGGGLASDLKTALCHDMVRLNLSPSSFISLLCSRTGFDVSSKVFSIWFLSNYVEPEFYDALTGIFGADSATVKFLQSQVSLRISEIEFKKSLKISDIKVQSYENSSESGYVLNSSRALSLEQSGVSNTAIVALEVFESAIRLNVYDDATLLEMIGSIRTSVAARNNILKDDKQR